TLHQVLRTVISAPILKIVLVDNKHLAFLSGATCDATKLLLTCLAAATSRVLSSVFAAQRETQRL
ncbi:MAG: hypothetical protein ACFN3D_03495, partial [Lancefieldella parvula]